MTRLIVDAVDDLAAKIDELNTKIDALNTKLDLINTKLGGGLPSALATDRLKTSGL